jgi:hypothetical protein
MTDNENLSTRAVQTRWLKGPVITFMVMTVLNILLGSGVGFGMFHLSAEVTWEKRLLLISITELGLFSWFWTPSSPENIWDILFAGAVCVGIPLLFVLTLRTKRLRLLWSIVGVFAVLLWFLLGFFAACFAVT